MKISESKLSHHKNVWGIFGGIVGDLLKNKNKFLKKKIGSYGGFLGECCINTTVKHYF
jgi:hypothetical protein